MAINILVQKLQENPVIRFFIVIYLSCTALGWFLLQAPFCQKKTIPTIDTLFTCISAISTTGLATIDIGQTFSFVGQLVILILIQLGGIGYMIFSSFIILNLEQRILNYRKNISYSPFSLSRGLTAKKLIQQTIIYTFICEVIGFIALYGFFKIENVENPLWQGLFHCISAFGTAGFSLFSSNMESYKTHFGINVTLSVLSLLGAFGFFLWIDIKNRISNLKECIKRSTHILYSFIAIVIPIVSFLFLLTATFPEKSSIFQKAIISFFQVISSLTTAGFNTIDMKMISHTSNCLFIILMLIGVSLTTICSHIKDISFKSLLVLLAKSLSSNNAWNRKILYRKLQFPISIFLQYFFISLAFALLLHFIEKQSFLSLLFEATSAMCTIGFSVGMTPELSHLGKSLLIFLMFVGRIGILIFGFYTALSKLDLKPLLNSQVKE